jgi:hypothetical protein
MFSRLTLSQVIWHDTLLFLGALRICWPEPHRRAQPLRPEARNAKNVRKSAIPGMSTPEPSPICGVLWVAAFRMAKRVPHKAAVPYCWGGFGLGGFGPKARLLSRCGRLHGRHRPWHWSARLRDWKYTPRGNRPSFLSGWGRLVPRCARPIGTGRPHPERWAGGKLRLWPRPV